MGNVCGTEGATDRAMTHFPVITVCAKSLQWCLTLWNPMDPPGSSVHGIHQEKTLVFPSPGDLPHPGIKPCVSYVSCTGRWILYQHSSKRDLGAERREVSSLEGPSPRCWELFQTDTAGGLVSAGACFPLGLVKRPAAGGFLCCDASSQDFSSEATLCSALIICNQLRFMNWKKQKQKRANGRKAEPDGLHPRAPKYTWNPT